jgi:AhpC/TSA antioxidant enzyme
VANSVESNMPRDGATTLWRAFAFVAFALIGVTAAAAAVQMQRAAVTAAAAVPASMQLTESLRNAVKNGVLQATKLLPIALRNDPVTLAALVETDIDNAVPLQDVVRSYNAPSLCFVVRRPGCILCREHGQQLSELAAEWRERYKNVTATKNTLPPRLWGTVKEVHVDDEGLLEFHREYFTFPLYHDVEQTLYNVALGRRTILSLPTWNPWRLYRGFADLRQRLASKPQLAGNLKGEGMIQGGFLLFDAQGHLRYALLEEIGNPLNLDDIRAAMDTIMNDVPPDLSTSATRNDKVDEL